MISPYLNLKLRTPEEAVKDMDENNRDFILAHIENAIVYLQYANAQIEKANKRVGVGSELADERNGITDLISDLQGHIKRINK
jgi:hypothetical protein